MGRTVKISELKKFDVFKYMDLQYVLGNDRIAFPVNIDKPNYKVDIQYWLIDYEVELIGHMEFKEELDGLDEFNEGLKKELEIKEYMEKLEDSDYGPYIDEEHGR